MDDVVDKEFVKSLQEHCTEMVVEEVNESKTKNLIAFLIVPGWEVVQEVPTVHRG